MMLSFAEAREWAVQLPDGKWLRHLEWRDAIEYLERSCSEGIGVFASVAGYANPSVKDMDLKGLIWADILIDLDFGEELWDSGQAAAELLASLDALEWLRERLGGETAVEFSGRKGWHASLRASEDRPAEAWEGKFLLVREQRSQLVWSFIKPPLELEDLAKLLTGTPPRRLEWLEELTLARAGRLVLGALEPLHVLRERGEWRDLLRAGRRAARADPLSAAAHAWAWHADVPVVHDLHRLSRAPGSCHPATGRRVGPELPDGKGWREWLEEAAKAVGTWLEAPVKRSRKKKGRGRKKGDGAK